LAEVVSHAIVAWRTVDRLNAMRQPDGWAATDTQSAKRGDRGWGGASLPGGFRGAHATQENEHVSVGIGSGRLRSEGLAGRHSEGATPALHQGETVLKGHPLRACKSCMPVFANVT